ncbi:hypothetical protein BX616_008974, partial [Lobosporangium transversale]
MVCESCSEFKVKLPQFGYNHEVRCCSHCAHFLKVFKMDYAALSKLNIKTLRGYLRSYNIPTQGMLEKQDLIQAIQSYKPIPEASEVYFRQHLPSTPAKSSSLLEELTGLGRSESPSGSSDGSSSSNTGEGFLNDIDRFFSRLFGSEDQQSSSSPQANRPRPQTQPQPRPQPPPGASYRPPPGNPPPRAQTRASQQRNVPPQQPPRPSTMPNTPLTPNTPASSWSQTSQSPTQPKLTLEELLASRTDPSTLSIKVIKGLLDDSCVTYVGVVEKKDLVERLQKLIDNTKAEKAMLQEQEALSALGSNKPAESSKSSNSKHDDDNLCKICCDAALNCVMLNCNHMSTCMD